MHGQTAFRTEQRRVAIGMAAALAVSALAIGIILFAGPIPAISIGRRLASAVTADLFVVLWLVAAIANVARLRFVSPGDIGGSAAADVSDRVRIANAILQNTLEQAVLAVVVHLAVAVLLPDPEPLLATLAALFCVGRACFWAGYRRGAAARAFGFALTFYPSAIMMFVAGMVALTGWNPQG